MDLLFSSDYGYDPSWIFSQHATKVCGTSEKKMEFGSRTTQRAQRVTEDANDDCPVLSTVPTKYDSYISKDKVNTFTGCGTVIILCMRDIIYIIIYRINTAYRYGHFKNDPRGLYNN